MAENDKIRLRTNVAWMHYRQSTASRLPRKAYEG